MLRALLHCCFVSVMWQCGKLCKVSIASRIQQCGKPQNVSKTSQFGSLRNGVLHCSMFPQGFFTPTLCKGGPGQLYYGFPRHMKPPPRHGPSSLPLLFSRELPKALSLLIQIGSPLRTMQSVGQPLCFIVLNPGARRCNTPPRPTRDYRRYKTGIPVTAQQQLAPSIQ